MYCTCKRSVRAVFATAHQAHSRHIFFNKRFSLWINWLINKKEYLPIRWWVVTTCLLTFSLTDMPTISTTDVPTISTTDVPTISTTAMPTISTTDMPTISTNLEKMKTYAFNCTQRQTVCYLFVVVPSKPGIIYRRINVAHHPSPSLRKNKNYCCMNNRYQYHQHYYIKIKRG